MLHDANEEGRGPEVLGRLKAVLDEVVAALGGGEAQHIGWSSRRVTTWSTGGDPRWYEPDFHAWRAMRLREARAQLNRDWLAWDSNTRVARGRWWNPQHPAGPFDGIDRTVADGPGLADWLPASPIVFGVDRGAADIRAVADGTFEVSREDFYRRVSFDLGAPTPTPAPARQPRHRGRRRAGFRPMIAVSGQSSAVGWHSGLQARLLADQRRHENPADVFGDGREWSRDLAKPARGYRPRWAPLLASELANLLPRREPPAPEAR